MSTTLLLGATLSSITTERHSLGLAPAAATMVSQRSPWQSPVTYLFGGLAAMLGLIALALLILACSYWRLSRAHQSNQDLEKGDVISKMKTPPVYEDKFVVIMAGNDKPTYLANPVQLFLNPTPNQDLILVPKDESSTSSKEDGENDQHHN